jgi:hypothetical protein
MEEEEKWLKDDDEVQDFIIDHFGLYSGEGLEEAFKKWKALPKEDRTELKLTEICKSIATIEFDPYDPPDWMPVL